MARGRMINITIAGDIALNDLSLEAHLAYLMAIPHLDRDGLLPGHPKLVKGRICPLRDEIGTKMGDVIQEWIASGLAISYNTDNGAVLFFTGFQKNQNLGALYAREAKSIFPPPPGYIRTNTGLIQEDYNQAQPTETPAAGEPLTNSESTHELVMSDSNTEQELLNPSRARLEVEDQDQVEDQLLGSSWPSAQGTHTELDNNAIIEKPTKPKAKTRPPSPNSADPPPSLPDKQHMPQQEMFAAVCEAIGWDHNTLSKEDKGQVAQACGILSKANYSVDDIRRFMVEIWFKDWRWAKEGQHPTLKQLRQEIGKTRSLIPGVAPPPKSTNNGTTAIQDYKARKGMVSR